MRNILILIISGLTSSLLAQSLDELKAKKAALEAELAPIQAQVAPIKAQIDALNADIAKFPGWYKGAFGTLGLNFTRLNNWVVNPNPNSRATTIIGSFNAFANRIDKKYFWRNNAALNMGWQKLNLVGVDSESKFEPVTDLMTGTSLLGYNLSSKLALSALGEYRTTVIRNFNNPGYFDIGVGFTYTPIPKLVVVLHPLNYNFIFSKDDTKYTSSLGTKLVADYNATLYKGVKWRSNLTSFISYKSSDPALSNFTWTNGFSFTLLKGVGVGLEHAIRSSKQESSDMQSYYIVGLSYSL
jgi:hypothetical protein